MKPELLRRRADVLRAIRAFFDARGFVEIEAPVVVVSPGMEPHLDAFELKTEHARRYLHTSPEYALKRLLGAGFDRIYSLGPCFRDEPPSRTHSPEFTMLEWYAAGLDLHGLMDQTEALVRAAHAGAGTGAGAGAAVEMPSGAFERLSVRDAFVRYAGVDPWRHGSVDALRAAARAAGHRVAEGGSWDDVFFEVHLDAVEPRLGVERPTFLWGWPASQAALSRLDPADPSVALRFELYAGGFELANAFDELIDAGEQRRRFEGEQAARRSMGRAVLPIDEALLDALGRMKPTAGIALGVDRLVMWLLGAGEIADVRAQAW